MRKETFLAEMKNRVGIELPNGNYLFRKHWEITDSNIENGIKYGTLDNALSVDVGGLTLGEWIKQSSIEIFKSILD